MGTTVMGVLLLESEKKRETERQSKKQKQKRAMAFLLPLAIPWVETFCNE
jgi:hypothetical protein